MCLFWCVWPQAKGSDQINPLGRLVPLSLDYEQQKKDWNTAELLLHYTFIWANKIHKTEQWEEITFEQYMMSLRFLFSSLLQLSILQTVPNTYKGMVKRIYKDGMCFKDNFPN